MSSSEDTLTSSSSSGWIQKAFVSAPSTWSPAAPKLQLTQLHSFKGSNRCGAQSARLWGRRICCWSLDFCPTRAEGASKQSLQPGPCSTWLCNGGTWNPLFVITDISVLLPCALGLSSKPALVALLGLTMLQCQVFSPLHYLNLEHASLTGGWKCLYPAYDTTARVAILRGPLWTQLFGGLGPPVLSRLEQCDCNPPLLICIHSPICCCTAFWRHRSWLKTCAFETVLIFQTCMLHVRSVLETTLQFSHMALNVH